MLCNQIESCGTLIETKEVLLLNVCFICFIACLTFVTTFNLCERRCLLGVVSLRLPRVLQHLIQSASRNPAELRVYCFNLSVTSCCY